MTSKEAVLLAGELKKHKPNLYICGGGHIALYLAEIADILDFNVTVLEDREEYATKERFPQAQVILGNPTESLKKLEEIQDSYFVVASRSHGLDKVYLKTILERGFLYVGMLASKDKVAYVMGELKKEGIEDATLARVYSPIGLDISAVTPSEIAVSILGEIIKVKNEGGQTAYAGTEVIRAIEEGQASVLVTIVDKGGSAPRGIGSMLVLKKDDGVVGTIGGGSVEKISIEKARELAGTDAREDLEFDVSAKGKLGMVCGGQVTVRVETIID